MTDPTDIKSKAYWKNKLSPDEFRIAREKGTEPPFTGKYYNCVESGVYCCICCGQPLFKSDSKYDSGSGWPSFWAPLKTENIRINKDYSHGASRLEASCSRCEAHLGHLFDDGPAPTFNRYCINSASLKLIK